MKQNEKKQKTENIIDDNIGLARFFELTTSNTICVNSLNLHEIKYEILEDYTGDSKLTGSMLIGEIELKTNLRFESIDDVESYIIAIDVDYDSEDVIFSVRLYNINTLDFHRVKISI